MCISKKSFFKFLIVILFPIWGSGDIFAQSKKDIRKNNIKGITEIITEYDGGKEVTHNDVSRKFDKEGEVIQEINYDKNGVLKEKTLTKNNKDGDKIEETIFDANGKQSKRFAYKYDGFGQKIEEIEYDAKNILFTKSVYSNNAKGLKTERKTYDAKGKLIQVKKYIYE
jgi:uncharacterized protein YkuJ